MGLLHFGEDPPPSSPNLLQVRFEGIETSGKVCQKCKNDRNLGLAAWDSRTSKVLGAGVQQDLRGASVLGLQPLVEVLQI